MSAPPARRARKVGIFRLRRSICSDAGWTSGVTGKSQDSAGIRRGSHVRAARVNARRAGSVIVADQTWTLQISHGVAPSTMVLMYALAIAAVTRFRRENEISSHFPAVYMNASYASLPRFLIPFARRLRPGKSPPIVEKVRFSRLRRSVSSLRLGRSCANRSASHRFFYRPPADTGKAFRGDSEAAPAGERA
jgi:hypothetical protein